MKGVHFYNRRVGQSAGKLGSWTIKVGQMVTMGIGRNITANGAVKNNGGMGSTYKIRVLVNGGLIGSSGELTLSPGATKDPVIASGQYDVPPGSTITIKAVLDRVSPQSASGIDSYAESYTEPAKPKPEVNFVSLSWDEGSGITELDVTQQHTAHVTVDVTGSFNALVMLGVGCFPSVYLNRCNPNGEESSGGKAIVSLSGGQRTLNIPVGLNYWDESQNPGWSGSLHQVLYVEDADSGDVILDDTEIDGLIQVYKPVEAGHTISGGDISVQQIPSV